MSGRASWLLMPFVVAVYLGVLAPLIVVIAVSLGPSPNFEVPPSGLTLRWFEAFFASGPFVSSLFRVSLVVGLLAASIATLIGTAAAVAIVRFRFFGREALETFFLTPLLVPQILLGAALPGLSYVEWRRNQRAIRLAEPLPQTQLPKILAVTVGLIALLAATVDLYSKVIK